MKSKQTKYKGYNFRSRTEARWAVFFDAMDIKYWYEHEDVNLKYHGRYLPDFYLPDFSGGCYVEVKGVADDHSIAKCKELALQNKTQVLFLVGPPDFRTYTVFHFDEESGSVLENEVLIKADQSRDSNSFFWEPGYQNEDGSIPVEYHENLCMGVAAIQKSRTKRFEFL